MTAPAPTHGCFSIVERLPGGRVRVRCVCGNTKTISRQALHKRPPSCGDWRKHQHPWRNNGQNFRKSVAA